MCNRVGIDDTLRKVILKNTKKVSEGDFEKIKFFLINSKKINGNDFFERLQKELYGDYWIVVGVDIILFVDNQKAQSSLNDFVVTKD